jgi:phospholipid-translocating ATPase
LMVKLTLAPNNPRRKSSMAAPINRGRRDMSGRVRDAVIALATCHNVSFDLAYCLTVT